VDHRSFDILEANVQLSGTGTKTVTLSYSDRYDYTVYVVDSSNNPVYGANVRLQSFGSESTNSSGAAEFDRVEAGVYTYDVSSSSGSASGKLTIDGNGSRTISLSGTSSGSGATTGDRGEAQVVVNKGSITENPQLTLTLTPRTSSGSTITRTFYANNPPTISLAIGEYSINVTPTTSAHSVNYIDIYNGETSTLNITLY
jgi:hypothetical protein